MKRFNRVGIGPSPANGNVPFSNIVLPAVVPPPGIISAFNFVPALDLNPWHVPGASAGSVPNRAPGTIPEIRRERGIVLAPSR